MSVAVVVFAFKNTNRIGSLVSSQILDLNRIDESYNHNCQEYIKFIREGLINEYDKTICHIKQELLKRCSAGHQLYLPIALLFELWRNFYSNNSIVEAFV